LFLQVVLLVEQLVNSCPASPSLLQLLLQASKHTCCDAQFTAWLAPLAIRTCCTCEPPAPVAMWAAVIGLAGQVSGSAAAELARMVLQVHPWSLQLWQLHYDTSGAFWAARSSVRALLLSTGQAAAGLHWLLDAAAAFFFCISLLLTKVAWDRQIVVCAD
jgi:hypothetical protein